MYTKQDSIFWWNLERYVGKNKKLKNLSQSKKQTLENCFNLTYYGLMQYQLYKGRQLQTIELANLDHLIAYMGENLDLLVKAFLKDNKTKRYSAKDRQEFMSLLEEIVLPYINDFSFEKLNEFRDTSENILTFIMQLAIKNQYDINITNELKSSKNFYYSQIYPFMVTLLILDPTSPEKIYDKVANFFQPEVLQEHYRNGRSLTAEEIEVLSPQMDLLSNQEDYNFFLFNFSEENWMKSDLQTRFKLVFQLSKLTAILLKENIYSLTYLTNESDLYDLVEFYLPIILRSEEEIKNYLNDDQDYYFERQQHANWQFLRPWSIKDFDPELIKTYYEKMKVYDIQFEMDKLYKMMDVSLYASTYIRVLDLLGIDSNYLQKVLIDNKQLALVNTLKIFKLHNDGYEQIQNFDFSYNEAFLDTNTLKKIENVKLGLVIRNNLLTKRINVVLKMFSYMLALDPSQVKEFGYSLDEFVRYYLILYGPYKKTKIGYETNDFFLLTKKIIEIVAAFKKKYIIVEENEKQLIKSGYYLHIYLIEKLLEFSKLAD